MNILDAKVCALLLTIGVIGLFLLFIYIFHIVFGNRKDD